MTFSPPHNDCTLDTEASDAGTKLPLAFVQRRHTEPIEGNQETSESWHLKERTKTMSIALVLCLNVGVDPPDVYRTQPHARLESWIDPLSMPAHKALETIGLNLQRQYERWQPRARYKQSLDPTVEDIRKVCTSLRRNSKEDRVLFHYNGHGVPKPTVNGEIWVFNREYTQYLPLSLYDLQTWMGTPSVYIYDCSNAGVIVKLFEKFAKQHEEEYERIKLQDPEMAGPKPSFRNCIQLAACAADQVLPTNPNLPADIFSSCLTTPIKIAIHWYMMRNSSRLIPDITLETIDKIPGPINDRRTMLGELNWIFSAVTNTIAWNVLPRELFQKLFRQDLLVSALFRNYLLAERILRSYNCTPVSSPSLPPTFHHPMWRAWDHSLDLCLSQLPAVLKGKEPYRPSLFFEEQMTAFEIWLTKCSDQRKNPPEQLMTILQVLLSQNHRLRALVLLKEFLNLGLWAVDMALSVGMYPYMLKLLQSPAIELRDLLVCIWAKISAVESTCKVDLVRDNGYKYFLQIIHDVTVKSKFRAMAAFVMSVIVKGHPAGQEIALQKNLVAICLEQMNDNDTQLRLWIIICLANLWERYDKAKWCGVRDSAHEKLCVHLKDGEPEVRAAAVYALGAFLNSESERTEHAINMEQIVVTMLMNIVTQEMSALVRMELINALQWVVIIHESSFTTVAAQEMRTCLAARQQNGTMHSPTAARSLKRNAHRERRSRISNSDGYNCATSPSVGSAGSSNGNLMDRQMNSDKARRTPSSSSGSSSSTVCVGPLAYGSFYTKMWQCLLSLEDDPHPAVAAMARTVLDYIRDQAYECVNKEWADKTKLDASFSSLPSSPSSRSLFLADSPPHSVGSSVDLNKFGTKLSHPSQTPPTMPMPDLISNKAPHDNYPKRLVSTKFLDWCYKQFNEPEKRKTEYCDHECKEHLQRQWRYLRNQIHLREAKNECHRARQFKFKNEIFSTRCATPPRVMLFHPFESHFVTSVSDAFTVWDYNSNSKLSHWGVDCGWWNRVTTSRITALDFVNAQDVTMLMVGTDDGCVRLWSNYTNSIPNHEPTLITAWQALPEIPTASYKSSSSSSHASAVGLRLVWDQQTRTLLAGGDERFICMWDAESELARQRVMTNADSSVNCLSVDHAGGGNIFAAGFVDGSIRIFDRRLPAYSCKTITYREHTAPVISARIKHNSNVLVAGCQNGVTKMYDIRKRSTLVTCRTNSGSLVGAFDVHREANLFACGGVNLLTSYDLQGNVVDCIQNNDWFVPQRVPSIVSHLVFHPNRVIVGYSLVEGNIVVSSLVAKKQFTNISV